MRQLQVLVSGLVVVVGLSSTARADDAFTFVGFALGNSSNRFETKYTKAEFTNTNVTMEGYGIGGPIYYKMSLGFWGFLGTNGGLTHTDKTSGVVEKFAGSNSYLPDQFLFLLPRMEFGYAFRDKGLRPTVGVILADSAVATYNGSTFYALDPGIAFGLALNVGPIVIHPTLHFSASFYNGQRHFFDGGGGGFEVVAGVTIKKVAVFIRAGVDGHTWHGTGWSGAPQNEEGIYEHSSAYFRFGIGYVPID
jgi:hypothetical protein